VTDLVGRRFGSLVVASLDEATTAEERRKYPSRGGHTYWRCRCDCGAEVSVRSNGLTSGRTVSCGCWRATPAVRQAARMQTPPERRVEIARLGQETLSEKRRRASLSRKKRSGGSGKWFRGGGRPRSDQPRCPCGAMTLRRAIARGHRCDHL
jgi:hypothetical protein